MTMTIDSNQQRFGALNFNHMHHYSHPPHFNNPWGSSSTPSQSQNAYTSSNHLSHNLAIDTKPRISNASISSYASVPITSASTGSSLPDVYGTRDVLNTSQELLSPSRSVSSHSGYGNDSAYSNAPSPIHSYAPTSAPYESMGYSQAPTRTTYVVNHTQEDTRRLSHPSVSSVSSFDDPTDEQRMQRQNSYVDFNDREPSRSFADQIDASREMIAMSQNTTPRNIYGAGGHVNGRGSTDAYGFPATHSTSSSVSSSGNYPSYFTSSVDSSVSDYSNTNSDMESVSSRTLPRPSNLLGGGVPPAPQSMMGQFSSKINVSTQKKHKCKVCDKRFTRPSSLQTHMYSHTGEKPFMCEVECCGRHFSVVSNLRRHRKVHKNDARSEAGSSDHQSMDDE